jgi:hypothetical protein
LRDWISEWAGEEVAFLTPDDWPTKHERGGTYVWDVPPAAATAGVEWMASSIHKRSDSTHVFVVPRLMTAWFYRVLSKACDLIFTVPIDSDVWDANQFEPLLIGLYLPLSSNAPWRHKGTPRVDEVLRSVSKVWKESFERASPILRKFLVKSRGMAAV